MKRVTSNYKSGDTKVEATVITGNCENLLMYFMVRGGQIVAHGTMAGDKLRDFTVNFKVSILEEYASALYDALA